MKKRIIFIVSMTVVLSFLVFGVVKEFGQDIPFQTNAAFSVTQINEGVHKEDFFKEVKHISQSLNYPIYKPMIKDAQGVTSYRFDQRASSEEEKEWEVLLQNNITGMYYVNGPIPIELSTYFQHIHADVHFSYIAWYLLPIHFLFGNLRSIAVWLLLFLFFFTLLILKLRQSKKSAIYRSLGLLKQDFINNLRAELLILTLLVVLEFILFVFYQQTISSIFVWSFGLNFFILYLLLAFLVLSANLVYYQSIKSSKSVNIVKGKVLNPVVIPVTFIGLILAMILSGFLINNAHHLYQETFKQVKVLDKWSSIDSFVKVTWFDPFANQINENQQIDPNAFREEAERTKQMLKHLGDENVLLSLPSSLNRGLQEQLPMSLKTELIKEGVSLELGANLIYVNQTFIDKNKELQAELDFPVNTEHSLGTIYLPESYRGKEEDIRKIVDFEWLQGSEVKADSLAVQFVPNNQVLFLFNPRKSEKETFARQEIVNPILVSFNLVNVEDPSSLANLKQHLLFKEDALLSAIIEAKITNLSMTENINQTMILEREKVWNQLLGSMIAIVFLLVTQVLLMVQFALELLGRKMRKVTLQILNGESVYILLFGEFKWYLLGILCSLSIIFVLTGNGILVSTYLIAILLECCTLLFILKSILIKKRISIVKGEY